MKKSSKMAGKDGQTHPNAEMRLDSEHACMRACMECQREMGGGGEHLMGAPTNWKDGLLGWWWAKLPWVLEWQGQTGRAKCGIIWPEMEVGKCMEREHCWGELERGGGPPKRWAGSQRNGRGGRC